MNSTTDIICMEASKVTLDIWKYIKSKYPRKYIQIQKDIEAWGGVKKAKIYFTKGLKPVELAISLE